MDTFQTVAAWGLLLSAYAPFMIAVAAIGTFVLTWHNNGRINTAIQKVNEVHILINSRLTDWLKDRGDIRHSTGDAEGYARGLAQGIELDRVRPVDVSPIVSPTIAGDPSTITGTFTGKVDT